MTRTEKQSKNRIKPNRIIGNAKRNAKIKPNQMRNQYEIENQITQRPLYHRTELKSNEKKNDNRMQIIKKVMEIAKLN